MKQQDDLAERADSALLANDGADTFDLVSVGLDVGTSTTHLTLSNLRFRRQGSALSSEFEIVARSTIYQSPVVFTPYAADNIIDAPKLGSYVRSFLGVAAVRPRDIDAGLVVITGEALLRANSKPIATSIAAALGSFTCISAGARHEAILAAYGSGAVQISQRQGSTVLAIDIGGGTTKVSVIQNGTVTDTFSVRIGARLVSLHESTAARIEEGGRAMLTALGESLRSGDAVSRALRRRLAGLMTDVLFHCLGLADANVSALASRLLVAPPLAGVPDVTTVDSLVFSGGVGEYIYDGDLPEYDDLGRDLAEAIRMRLSAEGLIGKIVKPVDSIRATVVGAGSYTVQASGATCYVSELEALPATDLLVLPMPGGVASGQDTVADSLLSLLRQYDRECLTGREAIAIALEGVPDYRNLRGLAEGLVSAAASSPTPQAVFVVIDRDFGYSLGSIIKEELGWPAAVTVIDGVKLHGLTYIDIGRPKLGAALSLPVTVKSLLFPTGRQVAGHRAV